MGIALVDDRVGIVLAVAVDAAVGEVQDRDAHWSFAEQGVRQPQSRGHGSEQSRRPDVRQGLDGLEERLAVRPRVCDYMQSVLVTQQPHPRIGGQFGDFSNHGLLRGLDEGQIPGEIDHHQDDLVTARA